MASLLNDNMINIHDFGDSIRVGPMHIPLFAQKMGCKQDHYTTGLPLRIVVIHNYES